jgi:hypothetical protein
VALSRQVEQQDRCSFLDRWSNKTGGALDKIEVNYKTSTNFKTDGARYFAPLSVSCYSFGQLLHLQFRRGQIYRAEPSAGCHDGDDMMMLLISTFGQLGLWALIRDDDMPINNWCYLYGNKNENLIATMKYTKPLIIDNSILYSLYLPYPLILKL